MIKQRKRISTKGILAAANWVRENIHQLNDRQMTKTEWCDLLSEGAGEQFTITTAIEILEANGVKIEPKTPKDPLTQRVLFLEQQVADIVRSIQSKQTTSKSDQNDLFGKSLNDTESEVINEFATS